VLSLRAEAAGCMVPPMDACFPASHWRTDVGSGMLRKCHVSRLLLMSMSATMHDVLSEQVHDCSSSGIIYTMLLLHAIALNDNVRQICSI